MPKESRSVHVVQAPLYPTYRHLACVIRSFNGEPVQRVRDTITAITDQTGTPQNPVDWSEPNVWISERLSGESRTLAQKVWTDSKRLFNPRYMYGCYLFLNREKLLDQVKGVYRLGERGRRFLAGDEATLRELDAAEGIPKLLSLVAERSPCRRADILPAWSDYLKAVSVFKTAKTFSDSMRRRLTNVVERALVSRDGNSYSTTEVGLSWLKGFSQKPEGGGSTPLSSKRTVVVEAAHAHNEEQLKAFKARLMLLEPAQFEHFVKELLDAMEYQDVQVTKISGDKGVDVIAKVQFGITEITEVVQVKRTETTIIRPTVDMLRGALPYHKAIRGTIITLGNFAKGAQEGALFVGAAPITLIDGKRLLELCVKHEVGLKRRPVEIFEIDDAFFAQKFGHVDDEEVADPSQTELAEVEE